MGYAFSSCWLPGAHSVSALIGGGLRPLHHRAGGAAVPLPRVAVEEIGRLHFGLPGSRLSPG